MPDNNTPPRFTRVLIANRGEIALRIVRACREAGLESVAVYSDSDRPSPFVHAADHAMGIGPSPANQSYLRIDKLLLAARDSGAGAIHPGYGFLAERADFAEAVEQAGLVFIGPPSAAIRAMGDKTEARRRMIAAGVPVVPGSEGPVTDTDAAGDEARRLGYPVLLKAVAGGGGRGMREVHREADLEGAVVSAASEAEKAFGDPRVYLEKLILRPRHIEIQILADRERTIHLGERECSIQRRHQKVVEEAPSSAVDERIREAMGSAAVAAADAVGYRGAGTCEFLLGEDGQFFFLEMNTRIQVEHPVTEMVYGVDLVREQLHIAAGQLMSLPAPPPSPRGWSIECRITSEDPANSFLPSTGTITYLRPPSGPGVRWDAGYEAGDAVTLHYDSLLAKLIVVAPTRQTAIDRMERALAELVIVGVSTNQAFLRRLLAHNDFRRGEIDIAFLERHPELASPPTDDETELPAVILAALLDAERRHAVRPSVADGGVSGSEWLRVARREGLR